VVSWTNVTMTMAMQSKSLIFFPISNAGVVGLNPSQGIDICVRLISSC
jgi:hypothetical protein